MVINEVSFPIYEIMIIFSIVIGCIYIFLSLKNENIEYKTIIIYFIFFFIFSIIFGKLYTYVAYGFKTSYMEAKLSSYGGLIGTVIWSIIYEKIKPANGKIIKYTILALPLIYSFTKVGCFFVGCCHGFVYNGPFAIKYPHISDEFLFPIQLIEIIVFFIMFILCNSNKDKKNITYITLSLIAITKFLAEFLRDTKFINSNQIFSLILLLVTIIVYKKTL